MEPRITAFTDGASKGNPGPGGWGAILVTPDGHVRELGGAAALTTNNKMELTGAIQALACLQENPGPVDVYTDSTYVIQGIKDWVANWRRRGWKTATGSPVLNRELWEELLRLTDERGSRAIKWHYVRGHVGIPGNERVDAIADGFAQQRPVTLYDGPLIGYPVAVLDVPDDTAIPARSGSASRSKAPAYSYLSVVDGVPMRHGTWAECERRVKGRAGARFKKATSPSEEAEILRTWGVTI